MVVLVKNRLRTGRRVRRCFTLIELLVLFGIAALTIVGASVLGKYVGGRFGWLLGGLAGFLVIPVCGAIWGLFIALAREGIPTLPTCRNGCCCGIDDYAFCVVDKECYWVCKCGDRHRRSGRLFLQVTDKGETTPLSIWRPFGGWFPAEQKDSGAVSQGDASVPRKDRRG